MEGGKKGWRNDFVSRLGEGGENQKGQVTCRKKGSKKTTREGGEWGVTEDRGGGTQGPTPHIQKDCRKLREKVWGKMKDSNRVKRKGKKAVGISGRFQREEKKRQQQGGT